MLSLEEQFTSGKYAPSKTQATSSLEKNYVATNNELHLKKSLLLKGVFFNPLNPKSDQHWIFIYMDTAESFINIMRMREMIPKLGSPRLSYLSEFSMSVPMEMYRKESRECGYWF